MTITSWHMQLSPLLEMLHLYPESAVPQISLVFREMWETANLDLLLDRRSRPVGGSCKRQTCKHRGATIDASGAA
jgi:hypothetical protein